MDQAEHGEDPEHLQQLAPIDHVFALGDCCARMDLALPALAQVCWGGTDCCALCLHGAPRSMVFQCRIPQQQPGMQLDPAVCCADTA